MQIKKYRSIVKQIDNPVEGVYTLTMESNSGRFRYDAGHFLHLAIDEYDPSLAWPESRCFSVQTSPEDSYLKLTYAVKGEFTNRMANTLKEGTEIWLKMPYGELFEQEHTKENTVFISGGTGITPYLSLFTDSSFINYSQPVLYAGFRDKSLNLYKDELQRAKEINPSLTVHEVYQDEQGILDIATILKKTTHNTSFFISGPPIMIKSFKNYLIENGVSESQVKTDDWE